MLPMQDAVDVVLSRARPLPVEEIPLSSALGRVLATDVVSARPHPPFAASIMDGYAVRASDCPGSLRVVGASRAGAPMTSAIASGACAYVTTGAPIPPGADAVVPHERCEKILDDDDDDDDARAPARAVRVLDAATPGLWTRAIGSDVPGGAVVLERGTLIGPHEIGVAALAGVRRVLYTGPHTTALAW